MIVPLGWCDAETRVYNERTYTFNIKQSSSDNGKTASCSVVQNIGDSTFVYGDNAPYYQWGRKDLMLAWDGSSSSNKKYYDSNYSWTVASGDVPTATTIQNPFTFYAGDDWSSTHNYDYWNINFTSAAAVDNTPVVKTVYDPAPAGFHEPCTGAFTSFTKDGNNTTSGGNFNISGGWNTGWTFYDYSGTRTIFFKALGDYHYYGNLQELGSYGNYWSAGASSAAYGRHLCFYAGLVRPQDAHSRAYGFPCRPVSE